AVGPATATPHPDGSQCPTRTQPSRPRYQRIETLTERIDAVEKDRSKVDTLAPQLLQLRGCAHLTAAKILAETAGISRFRHADAYTAYTGTAPIPASSGNTHRHRLARGGNRQLNAAIHRIALTQARIDGPGRSYYLKP
ncbi:transposase, partial [Saccharopolyspora sp. NPDC003762]